MVSLIICLFCMPNSFNGPAQWRHHKRGKKHRKSCRLAGLDPGPREPSEEEEEEQQPQAEALDHFKCELTAL